MNEVTKKYRKDKIVYSLNVEDLQRVAEDILNRNLTNAEIEKVADRAGDYIDWYSAIEAAFDVL